MTKIKWQYIAGIVVTCAFFALLLIRLDFFQKRQEPVAGIKISQPQQPQDTWMNIYQNNRKIGFVHRTLVKEGGRFLFKENVFMEINTMGITQALNLATDGELNPDMTLSSFNFNLNSSLFQFIVRGRVTENKLVIFTGTPDKQEKNEIPLSRLPHISGSIYDAAFQTGLNKGVTRGFSIFDPSTLSLKTVNVTRNADEIIPIMGKRLLLKKYCADFMGARHCAWLDRQGNVLKETGILGLSMEKTTRESALAEIDRGASVDFTQIASIPSNAPIDNAETLRELKIKLSGIPDTLHLSGDRQRYEQSILTITRESIDPPSGRSNKIPADIAIFLKPSALIQSGDPDIKQQVGKIIRPSDSDEQKAKKIIQWVFTHIEKKPTLSVPNALEVLKNRSGDCNEHSVLTVALLRAAGIPAQSEAGLIYLRGRFYYHAWCVLYLNRWITADAVFNQFPADVTHIRLVRGESDQQLNLMGVIGKTKLEVLSQTR